MALSRSTYILISFHQGSKLQPADQWSNTITSRLPCPMVTTASFHTGFKITTLFERILPLLCDYCQKALVFVESVNLDYAYLK